MLNLSGVKHPLWGPWWQQQLRPTSQPLLRGPPWHTGKKETPRAQSDLAAVKLIPCYSLEGLFGPTAQSLRTFAEPSFKVWADWKATLFCSSPRRFLERQIEGHSATNLTSIQPEPDSCRLQYSLWEESDYRKTLAAWKWQSTWEPLGDVYCGSGSDCVFSCACLRLAGFHCFSEARAFCRGGPAERTAEVCPRYEKASLFRLRFQSTTFYYILMIRVIFYS